MNLQYPPFLLCKLYFVIFYTSVADVLDCSYNNIALISGFMEH